LNIRWRQARLAWIADISNIPSQPGIPLSHEIDSSIETLCAQLLKIGGISVSVPFSERDSKKLIRRAKVIPSINVIVVTGDPGQCHSNCARIWENNRNTHQIVTGYALTKDDDIWRQHSWLLDKAGHIIETVSVRQTYYGMLLNYFEAILFSKTN